MAEDDDDVDDVDDDDDDDDDDAQAIESPSKTESLSPLASSDDWMPSPDGPDSSSLTDRKFQTVDPVTSRTCLPLFSQFIFCRVSGRFTLL